MTWEISLALFIGLAATIEDLARRQISNWISLLACVGGIAGQVIERGWAGLLDSVLGLVAGFCVFLVFYLLGGMGGGDIKLMAGFGAILGWKRLFWAALLTAAIGGVLALLYLAANAIANAYRRFRLNTATRPIQYIPYAPAITLGAWLALVPLN